MNKWSPQTRIVIITILLVLGPLLLGYGQFILIALTPWFPALEVWPLGRFFTIIAVIEAGLSYLLGDAYVAYYRHQSQNLTGTLPLKIELGLRLRRQPLLIASILHIVVAIISSVIFWF